MAPKSMSRTNGERPKETVTDRLNRINKNFQMSRRALQAWVTEQKHQLDEEERIINLQEEAIDVDYDEQPAKASKPCENDETTFKALIVEADRLLSKNNKAIRN